MALARLPDGRLAVPAAEAGRNFGVWREFAMNEPVAVTRHGRPGVVLLSERAFLSLQRGGTVRRDAVEHALVAAPAHATEAFVALDCELTILAVNQAFESLASRRSSDLVQRCWSECFPRSDATMVSRHLQQVLRAGEAVKFEGPCITSPDRRHAYSIFPFEGGVAMLMTNLTAQKMLEEEADERRAIDAAYGVTGQAGLIRLNIRGLMISASKAVAELTGFAPADMLDQMRLTDILRPRDRIEAGRAIEQVLRGSEPRTVQAFILAKSGEELAVRLTAAPLLREGVPNGAMVVMLAT